MSKRSDSLLNVLSTRGDMSWKEFKDAFDYLEGRGSNNLTSPPVQQRLSALRILEALGHCEADFQGGQGKVFVAPAALVRLPLPGFPQAVLCGARSATAYSLLAKCAEKHINVTLKEVAQAKRESIVPSRIWLQAEGVHELRAIAEELHITFVEVAPAWSILQYAGSLDDQMQSLEWHNGEIPNWPIRGQFDPHKAAFGLEVSITKSERLIRLQDPVRSISRHFFANGPKFAEIDLDWGRYAMLQRAQLNLLLYDSKRGVFAAPMGAPLPKLIARAVTMCSGYAATAFTDGEVGHTLGRPYAAFIDVPPNVARLTAKKLGQHLVERQINILLGEDRYERSGGRI